MQTRKDFCCSCLALTLAGLSAPLAFGRSNRGMSTEKKGQLNETEESKTMIASCGITCSECPAYVATRKNDDAMRQETAKKWSEMFKSDIKPEDINCDGCASDSARIFNYCRVCEIRKCAHDRKAENCARCADYPCKKLSDFLAQVPEAKATLEEIYKAK